MTTRIEVLDHGFVRLVSYMQPVPEERHWDRPDGPIVKLQPESWTGDLECVRNARVSFDADWRTGEDENSDAKLMRYLIRNRHTSPLEAMVFTFEIKCPLFIARQWHRHRTWAYNEVSARYAPLSEEFYVPKPEHVGTQSKSNKQARDQAEPTETALAYCDVLRAHSHEAFERYKWYLSRGVPRELARTFLPLNTYTRYFGTVSLHNLFHFISLRAHHHAQWEIQQYAKTLLELVRPVCPEAVSAFEECRKPQPWDEAIRAAIRAGNATREQIQSILEEFAE